MSEQVTAHLIIGVEYEHLVDHVGTDVAEELKGSEDIVTHGNAFTGDTWFIGRRVEMRDLAKPTWPAIFIETCKQVSAQFDMPLEKIEICNGVMTS